MKIYTKAGDSGETGLFGGERTPKDSLRIEAYGTLDELNAVVGGVLASTGLHPRLSATLKHIQSELFQLGAELATPANKKLTSTPIGGDDIAALEKEIDQMEFSLEPLKSFILPGGSAPSAALHLARTVCRRAERKSVTLGRSETLRPEIFQYLNRLSDYLFVAARFQNHHQGVADQLWLAAGRRRVTDD